MNLTSDVLFSSDLWEPALEKYASATNTTVKLFGVDLGVVFGPFHPTPLFQLFDGKGYDPGIFTECARRCLEQTEKRASVMVSKVHGLAVIGTSLVLDGKIVGAAVAGYVFVDFSQVSDIQLLAREAGIGFDRLWQVARQQKPVPQGRLMLQGELLQALGDALLRENARTRQLEENARAKDQARQVTEKINRALSESEERYRALFDLGPVAVYTCDAAGVIDNFNRRSAELWGRTPALGDTDERFCGSFKMFRPDGSFMPHEQCPMADVVGGKISVVRDQEVLIERPDGSQVTVVVNIRPLMSHQGEITGAINCFYDVSDRKRAEEALKESRENLERIVEQRTATLRELSSSLLRAQDDERRRISRELHDSVGQYLAHAKMTLAAFRRSDSPEIAERALADLVQDLDSCISETRTISHLLHPPLLDELGLRSAVDWYVEEFSKRSGIQVNLHVPRNLKRLPGTLELVFFRILQESLVNVHRHSQSSSVDIRLERNSKEATLEIRDHGRGIPAELLGKFMVNGGGGVGLRSMRGRITEAGGHFELQSDKKGTLIRVTVPLADAETNLPRTAEKVAGA